MTDDPLNTNEIAKKVKLNPYEMILNCGKGKKGCQETEAVINLEEKAQHKSQLRDIEVLCVRLGEREPAVGTEISLKEGRYKYVQSFAKGGGYLMLLQKIANPAEAILACRATGAKWKATGAFYSTLNLFSYEMGLRTIIENWQDLKATLKEKNIKRLGIYGKSQGGAHAQMLAPLIAATLKIDIKYVVTLASIGVSFHVRDIFEQVFRDSKTGVVGYYNDGNLESGEMDFIPYVGGRHINGIFYSVHPNHVTSEKEIKKRHVLIRLYYLIRSIFHAHLRQNTLLYLHQASFKKTKVKRKNPDSFFERLRFIIAWLFNAITFKWANPISYKDFFKQQTA